MDQRDKAILRHLSNGVLINDISKALLIDDGIDISLSTVEKSIFLLKKKHSAKSNFQLAVILTKEGLI